MVFSCSYNSLISNMQDISSIVEDAMSAEDDKSIIFYFSKGEDGVVRVRLCGISAVITFRRDLLPSEYTLQVEDTEFDSEGNMMFALKSKEVLNFLGTFKSLRKTKVDEVIFEQVKNKIRCTVVESVKLTKEENDKLEQELAWNPDGHDIRTEHYTSCWLFDMVMLMGTRVPFIKLEAPDCELVAEENGEFDLLSRSLIPLVERSMGVFGSLNFSQQSIAGFHPAFTAIMANIFPGDVFKDIRLDFRCLDFISKILRVEEDVKYAKTDKRIYFRTKRSEAFLVYHTNLTPYERQFELFSKEHMVAVDRSYLKDIIKRFILINDTIEISIDVENSMIKMVNSKFTQELPILSHSGMEGLGVLRFKMMPNYLNDAIIGDDTVFYRDGDEHNDELYMYYNVERKALCIGDNTKAWFTALMISLY